MAKGRALFVSKEFMKEPNLLTKVNKGSNGHPRMMNIAQREKAGLVTYHVPRI